jgi:hypothetical protein
MLNPIKFQNFQFSTYFWFVTLAWNDSQTHLHPTTLSINQSKSNRPSKLLLKTFCTSNRKKKNQASNKLTFKTSCNDDMLPKGLGDRGNDGGCSLGRAGAVRLAPSMRLI